MRKAAKRLRYAAEAVETAFGAKAARLAAAAESVQEVLGDLNDSVVTRALLRQLAAESAGRPGNALLYGRMHAAEERHAARAEAQFDAAWHACSRRRLRRWLRAWGTGSTRPPPGRARPAVPLDLAGRRAGPVASAPSGMAGPPTVNPTLGEPMTTNTVSRSLHDVGLAAWFGGTLANAVALNAAAGQAADQASTGRVVNAGWDRWTPVNGAAIGAYLAGSAVQLGGNVERIKLQEGVATMSLVKTSLTVAALAVTAYSRVLGRKVSTHGDVPVESGTEPSVATPDGRRQGAEAVEGAAVAGARPDRRPGRGELVRRGAAAAHRGQEGDPRTVHRLRPGVAAGRVLAAPMG